jgi:CRISPR-associated protein Cmr4
MKKAILGLIAETSVHAGVGQMVGVIDLPIQRESHTGWPCVYGSAVKGALRTCAESKEPKPTWIEEVFGPPPRDGTSPSDHGGALAVGDARLLLLPVRSLTTHFKWVTCPALLRRFKNDNNRLGITCNLTLPVFQPADTKAFVHDAAANDQPLFLEEFKFTQEHHDLLTIITEIEKVMARDNAIDLLSRQLVIVSDDIFNHLSKHATPISPHIAIDSATKTTMKGALWYEETLPPESVLYVPLVAQKSRKDGSSETEVAILNHVLNDMFPDTSPYFQLGGNETVGMGWCKIKHA